MPPSRSILVGTRAKYGESFNNKPFQHPLRQLRFLTVDGVVSLSFSGKKGRHVVDDYTSCIHCVQVPADPYSCVTTTNKVGLRPCGLGTAAGSCTSGAETRLHRA